MLPFAIKTFVLSIFEWPLKTGFTVYYESSTLLIVIALNYFISYGESLVKFIRFLLMQITVLIIATKLPWMRYHIILCHIISIYII